MTPTQKTATLCNNLHEWITTSRPQATSLWAKTGPQGTHLPLINHLADTACIASHLTEAWLSGQTRRFLAQETDLDANDVGTLLTWLAATHDVGKASVSFQNFIANDPRYAHVTRGVEAQGLCLSPGVTEAHEKLPHSLRSAAITARWLRDEYGYTDPSVEVVLAECDPTGSYYRVWGGSGWTSWTDSPPHEVAEELVRSTLRLPVGMTRNLTDFMDIEESLEARTPGVWGENPVLKHHVMLGVDASGRARIGRFWLRYDDHEGLLWGWGGEEKDLH